ncbi:hypothetical protein H4N58_08745 [Mumia sp. ZJ1417]|uniref:hypothetical protein n=1 Tax=Mumia sp. ZJ1417 TaxID=2708082 RepID=UPI001423F417|nr:hypothetical protein [Mumia sp. ZJ1417]QMW67917.1 hypothetical protein H4N58_08745 [Mumia sp. ZJ1417]
MDTYAEDEAPGSTTPLNLLRDELPAPINWNQLTADEAHYEWHDLDQWVKWLKDSHGLPPSIVPPFYYLHDELVWELSALHTHWLSCYHQTASPSAPNSWRRDFNDARRRLRDWVAIQDRDRHFEAFVRADVLRRRRIEAQVSQTPSD